MKKYHLIPLLVGLVVGVLGIVLAQVDPMSYVDMPSIWVTLILSLILTLTFYSPAEIRDAFRHAKEKRISSKKELQSGLVFFTALQKMIITSSVFGFLIGAVIIFSGMREEVSVGRTMKPATFRWIIKHSRFEYKKNIYLKSYIKKGNLYTLRRDVSYEDWKVLKEDKVNNHGIFRGWSAALMTFFWAAVFILFLTLPYRYALKKKLNLLE